MVTKSKSASDGRRMKVLVFVTLLAWVNITSTVSLPMGVTRNSRTLDPSDLSTKRFLRSDAAVSTSHHLQERALVSVTGLDQLITKIKSVATNLIQKIQLKWWGMRNKSPDYVFTALKLDRTGDNLFESPAFSQWITFVFAHNPRNPESAIFFTLQKRLGDGRLAAVLAAANQTDGAHYWATALQNRLLASWASSIDKSGDEVFKLLNLDKAGDRLFENPLFSTWKSYIFMVNTKSRDEIIIQRLSDRYGDASLAKMIGTATKVGRTEKLATDLQFAQYTSWLAQGANPTAIDNLLHVTATSDDVLKEVSLGYKTLYDKMKVNTGSDPTWLVNEKKVEDAFTRMSLHKTGMKLFQSPNFGGWAAYVSKLYEKNPSGAMFAKLSEHYGDVALAKMIAAAMKVKTTEKVATDLRDAQYKSWLTRKLTPDGVDGLLHVTANSDGLLKQVSRGYENFYGKTKVDISYDPTWLTSGRTADEVYKLLDLDLAGAKLFDYPELNKWASYVSKINKRNANDVMLAKLLKEYEPVDLAKLTASAVKGSPITGEVAINLRTALFKRWIAGNMTPNRTDSILLASGNSRNAVKDLTIEYKKAFDGIKLLKAD